MVGGKMEVRDGEWGRKERQETSTTGNKNVMLNAVKHLAGGSKLNR